MAPGNEHEFKCEDAMISENRLRAAINDACTCGGHGPHDPNACPACMVWHALVTVSETKLPKNELQCTCRRCLAKQKKSLAREAQKEQP